MAEYKRGHRYDDDFKKSAVAMIVDEGKTIDEVMNALGVKAVVLNNWLVKSLMDENKKLKKDLAKTPDVRVRELESENQRLRGELETLKRAIRIM